MRKNSDSNEITLKSRSTAVFREKYRSIAIISTVEPYRLAHIINLNCNLKLARTMDFAEKTLSCVSCFYAEDTELRRCKYFLIGKQSPVNFFRFTIPFNYLLLFDFDEYIDEDFVLDTVKLIQTSKLDTAPLCFDAFVFDLKKLFNAMEFMDQMAMHIVEMEEQKKDFTLPLNVE